MLYSLMLPDLSLLCSEELPPPLLLELGRHHAGPFGDDESQFCTIAFRCLELEGPQVRNRNIDSRVIV